MPRRAKAIQPTRRQVDAAPRPPPRAHVRPPWYRRGDSWLQTSSFLVSQLIRHVGAGDFRVAKFQRQWCWTDGQILDLLDSIRQGYCVGSILIWDRHEMAPATTSFGGLEVHSPHGNIGLIIDGQQRMGALYAAARSGRFWFDLQDGRVVGGEAGAWRMPAGIALEGKVNDLIGWGQAHAAEHGIDLDTLNDYGCAAMDALSSAEVTATLLPSRWDRARVVETYRRMNSTGTPVTAEELEAALASEADR